MTVRLWTLATYGAALLATALALGVMASSDAPSGFFAAGNWTVTALIVALCAQAAPGLAGPVRTGLIAALAAIAFGGLLNGLGFTFLASVTGPLSPDGKGIVFPSLLALAIIAASIVLHPGEPSVRAVLISAIAAGLLHIALLRGFESLQFGDRPSLLDDIPLLIWTVPPIWLGAALLGVSVGAVRNRYGKRKKGKLSSPQPAGRRA